MEITAKMVMQLRDETGLPMMECKKALEESGGDKAAAIELLRKKGLAQMSKRAARETSQGRLYVHHDPGRGRIAMVELLCETEPVVKTDDFARLGPIAAQAAAGLDTPTPEKLLEQPVPGEPSKKVADLLHDAVNRIRENIKFGRVATATGHFAHYLHHDGRKGVLVEFTGPCPESLALDVCMHVVAMRPACVRREEVDPKLVEAERRIAADQVKDKPANIIDKIVVGKINKWYAEVVLLEQLFVKDDKHSVGQVLKAAAPDLSVKQFFRFEIGEA